MKKDNNKKDKNNKEDLHPSYNNVPTELDLTELQQLAKDTNKNIFLTDNNTANLDNSVAERFFGKVIDNLSNDKNISLKTEYLSPEEQFAGTKLDFMIKKMGFTFAKTLMFNFEKKRVSLFRKSRTEMVNVLWEKEKERQRLETEEHNKKIGMM